MFNFREDLIGSHQIHISQVTNLCTIEAELLQNYSDGHLVSSYNKYFLFDRRTQNLLYSFTTAVIM